MRVENDGTELGICEISRSLNVDDNVDDNVDAECMWLYFASFLFSVCGDDATQLSHVEEVENLK